MKIYRYEIPFGYSFVTFKLPVGSRVVDAVFQPARAAFSVYVETPYEALPVTERVFCVLTTGDEVTAKHKHIRSVVMSDGFHCFHVYEVER